MSGSLPTSAFSTGDSGGTGPRARSPVGWALVAASVTGLAALLRFMNPWTGVAARHWPWAIEAPFGWTRNNATTVFFAALVVVPLVAAFFPAGRRRGILVMTAVALALTALADIAVFLHGVETYVPPLLGAIVAAGLYASRTTAGGGNGRIAAGVAGAVLLALLLYPQGSNGKPDPHRRNIDQDYRAVLPAVMGEIVTQMRETDEERRNAVETGAETGEQGAVAFATLPWTMSVLLATLLGLLGLLGAFRPPAPWMAWTALVAFLAATAYPPLWYGIDTWLHPEQGNPDVSRLANAAISLAHSFREQYAPFLLALFAATTDLARPREPGVSTT